ncbi:MAG: hypothetical protein QOI13_3562 [Paraburkholderia sp.]|nr:hypothetical protein [Paraburkholderia sp.]
MQTLCLVHQTLVNPQRCSAAALLPVVKRHDGWHQLHAKKRSACACLSARHFSGAASTRIFGVSELQRSASEAPGIVQAFENRARSSLMKHNGRPSLTLTMRVFRFFYLLNEKS